MMWFRRLLTTILFGLVLIFGGNCAEIATPIEVAAAHADVPQEQMASRAMPEAGLTFHYVRRYQPAIDVLAAEAPAFRERAQRSLGLAQMSPIEVWVLPKVADYYALRGEPSRAPEWAVGLSLTGRSTIIVAHGSQRAPEDVMFTYAHELAHVAVRSEEHTSELQSRPHLVCRL